MLSRAVKPVGFRRRSDPGMLGADVIRDEIENHLNSFGVRGGDEVLQILLRAEMLFDGIFIDGAVTVIILRRGIVVVHDRGEPDGSDAEVAQIIEVVFDAAEISAVIGAWFGTVVGSGIAGRRVVG